MKHLNIKWVPETVAIVSLTIATAEASSPGPELNGAPGEISCLARTKHIVISGQNELKAAVTTTAQAPL